MWTVYKHTTPSNKVYIGITQQRPEKRWLYGHGYKTNKHFYAAINRYGWDNIRHEIVEEALTQEEAEAKERELIFLYKSYDKRYGYNKALGGHALSEESRRKISKTRIERGIRTRIGYHHSDETKAKLSQARKGYHPVITDEWRQHIREGKLGDKNPNYRKPMREDLKERLIECHEKAVIQIVDGKEIRYKSIKTAEEMTGIAGCNITRVCKGQRAKAGGYAWRYGDA